MTFASDAFAGTLGTELNAYSALWVKQTGYTENGIIGGDGQWATTSATVAYACYRHTATPSGANYTVTADVVKRSSGSASPILGVIGRAAPGAQTFYWAIYTHSAGNIRLFKMVGGTQTQLGSSHSFTATPNVPFSLRLRMDGSAISAWLNGAVVVGPVTDTDITAAGHAGIIMLSARDIGVTDSGYIDNWDAALLAAPSQLSGTATLNVITASGGFLSSASSLSGTATLAAILASGNLGTAPGSVAVPELRNWGGSLQAGITIPVVTVCRLTTGVQVLTLTNQVTDGSGNLSITSAALVPGVSYMVIGWDAGGTQRFAVPLTAT